ARRSPILRKLHSPGAHNGRYGRALVDPDTCGAPIRQVDSIFASFPGYKLVASRARPYVKRRRRDFILRGTQFYVLVLAGRFGHGLAVQSVLDAESLDDVGRWVAEVAVGCTDGQFARIYQLFDFGRDVRSRFAPIRGFVIGFNYLKFG